MNTIDLEVQGMSCGSCVKQVTQALTPIRGVSDVVVDLPAGHVRVKGTAELPSALVLSALAAAGYPAKLAGTPESPLQKNARKPVAANGRGSCCCG